MDIQLQREVFLERFLLTIIYIFSLPFITHIYGGTITGLLYENLYLAASVLLFFSLLSFKSLSFNYVFYFSPMILIVIYNLFFPFGEYTVINCLKYLAYFGIFFLVFRRLFNNEVMIDIYVISMALIFSYLFIFYLYAYFYPEDLSDYRIYGSYLNQNNVFEKRTEWQYSILGFFSVIPLNQPDSDLNIFGLPRMFGFSPEPGFYSVFLVPALFLSMSQKRLFSSIILFIACLFSASGLFYLILLLAIVLFLIPKKYIANLYFLMILIIFFLIANLNLFISFFLGITFEEGRGDTYYSVLLGTIQGLYVGDVRPEDAGNYSGILKFYFDLGYTGLIAYVIFVGLILNFISKKGDIYLNLAYISAVLFAVRSGEMVPPILLFIISLVLTKIEITHENEKKINSDAKVT
jgi:hypothetical protein